MKGDLASNTFIDNEGDGAVKILHNFKLDSTERKNIKLLNNEVFLISNCLFEIGKNSNCCIFYDRGNAAASVEVQKCSFSGKLSDGSHYIDGKTIDKNGHKLIVKKCKFAYDSSKSLNMKDYLSIDLNDQTFAFENLTEDGMKKKSILETWMIVAGAAVAAVIVVVVVVVAVIIVKRKNPNTVDENENSNEVRDLLLSENSSTNENIINSTLI